MCRVGLCYGVSFSFCAKCFNVQLNVPRSKWCRSHNNATMFGLLLPSRNTIPGHRWYNDVSIFADTMTNLQHVLTGFHHYVLLNNVDCCQLEVWVSPLHTARMRRRTTSYATRFSTSFSRFLITVDMEWRIRRIRRHCPRNRYTSK